VGVIVIRHGSRRYRLVRGHERRDDRAELPAALARSIVRDFLADGPDGERRLAALRDELDGPSQSPRSPHALVEWTLRNLEAARLALLEDAVPATPFVAAPRPARRDALWTEPVVREPGPEKWLQILDCPPTMAPRRGPITLKYGLSGLAGEAVVWTLRSAKYPGEVLLERPLAAPEAADGSHEFTWDGAIEVGSRVGETATPELSPIAASLRHDAVYKDAAAFVIVPPSVEVLALGDFNFSTDREVMLPAPSVEGTAQGDRADGVALVAGLLAHLRGLAEERRALVVGHTDASGSAAHNLELSRRRADNVQRFGAGDRDGWASHAHEHAELADAQEVLRWVASRFGWPCDPGPVDGEDGPRTAAGRAAFRARYRHEFGGAVGSGDTLEVADWQAIFVMYEQDLAARLGVDAGGLAALREKLVFTEPKILGCGEHWPDGEGERPSVAREDRRVEVLLFHPDELPAPIGGDEPPGKSIYTPRAYRWLPIAPGPGPHPLQGPCFELGLALDDLRLVPEGAVLRLHGGPYDLRQRFSEAKREDGVLRFHFHGIAAGTTYALDFERPEGEAVALFVDADLDPYIAGIGDDAAAVRPIAFAELPLSGLPRRDDGGVTDLGAMTAEVPLDPRVRLGGGWLDRYADKGGTVT
jgi:hypothetical protein